MLENINKAKLILISLLSFGAQFLPQVLDFPFVKNSPLLSSGIAFAIALIAFFQDPKKKTDSEEKDDSEQ